MRIAHHTIVATLLVFGASWGLCLVVAGLYALGLGFVTERPDGVLVALGVAGLAAGNFVFMEVVADRLLTSAGKGFRDATEMVAAAILIGSLALAGIMWFVRTVS